MALETGTYISDLVITNPTATDPKSQGDDHLRLLKSVLKNTFANITGAVTPTHTELNYMAGVTSAVQTQINTKGAITGQAWTGAHDFTGGTPTVPTQAAGDNTTKAASTAFVAASYAPLASPTFTGTVVLPATTSIGTLTNTELGYVHGVTSGVQSQLDSKAPVASPTFTGTVTIPAGASISGFAPLASPALTGVPTAPTAALGTNTTQIATMAALVAQAFATVAPAQPGGTATYQLISVGGVAAWSVQSPAIALYLANNFGAF